MSCWSQASYILNVERLSAATQNIISCIAKQWCHVTCNNDIVELCILTMYAAERLCNESTWCVNHTPFKLLENISVYLFIHNINGVVLRAFLYCMVFQCSVHKFLYSFWCLKSCDSVYCTFGFTFWRVYMIAAVWEMVLEYFLGNARFCV